jgi:hypothetical protein
MQHYILVNTKQTYISDESVYIFHNARPLINSVHEDQI